MMQFHVDGDIVAEEDATVSVRDRGFMYGDGLFETVRAYGGTVFAWEAHADRLERGADRLGLAEALPPRENLRDRLDETLAANGLDDAYLKLTVTRGVQPGKLTPDPEVDPTVVVQARPLTRGGREGEAVYDGPAVVQSVKTRRVPDAARPADAKTLNYLDSVLARLELQRAATDEYEADEALLRDVEGHVAEGASSNLFFVDGGVLKTPTTDQSVLPGVTRSVVLELAREEEFPVETGRYDIGDVRDADEAFLTNATWEIRPIESVDGIDVAPGPMTTLLSRLYDDRVETVCYA